MSVVNMTVSDWIKVRDNPIQRDTERHAARAKHLLTPLASHAITFAAKLPNGELVKLDGHTRALLWKRNQVKHPAKVTVNVIDVDGIAEAEALYKTFDSKDALETATDKVSGGFRKLGFQPESPLLASGNITSALKIAWESVHGYAAGSRPRDVYQMVDEFSAEVLALDEMGLRKGIVTGGVLAAFFLSYRKHADKIVPFWRSLFGNSGVKINGLMDGVQALSELIVAHKGRCGGSAQRDMCARALKACESWVHDDMLASAPRPLDISKYFDEQSRAPKFRLIKKSKKAA